MRITLSPELLKWARERAALSEKDLAKKLGVEEDRVVEWETTGEVTYKQAEKLAKATLTPFGYLFLDSPPVEQIPIKDFRTLGGTAVRRPSPNLLDCIYLAQRRQEWFRDFLIEEGESPLPFVRSLTTTVSIEEAAKQICASMAIGKQLTSISSGWEDAVVRHFRELEKHGVLVMRSSLVGNNTSRKLSVNEFRGFALVDEYAPLVFINGEDSKAAQLFTLVHELVHLWIGESALSDLSPTDMFTDPSEQFCNKVAAEILVPRQSLLRKWNDGRAVVDEAIRIAKQCKVSSLVVLRKAWDTEIISYEEFRAAYQAESARYRSMNRASGGNYYTNIASRVGVRFANALVGKALSGETSLKEAMAILDVKSAKTLRAFAESLSAA